MRDPFDYLFSLEHFGIKLGLANMEALVAGLGHPERAFASIHVAGTNGKGSVTAMVDAVLRAAGHRAARYTSPHLVDLAERFVVDGTPIDRERLGAAIEDVRTSAERIAAVRDPFSPTFFEVTTAVAFEIFRRCGVEVAVCEVGLGGRLDATNVLTPMVCAITSIAFDHQQHLGNTLAAIAGEKAGIIKRGVPVVVGDLPPEAADVVGREAARVGAPIVRAQDRAQVHVLETRRDATRMRLRTALHDYGDIELPLPGTHQVGNMLVAVAILEALDKTPWRVGRADVVGGLASVAWPGRLERIAVPDGREVLLDAAHNPAGAAALASYLQSSGPKRPLVFAAMKDKDALGMLRALAPAIESLVVTRASNPRSEDPSALAAVARQASPQLDVTVEDDLHLALEHAWRRSPAIVVAGSIFLLGDVVERLRTS